MTREEYIQGLRALADFLENHSNLPDPPTGYQRVAVNYYLQTKDEAVPIVRILGRTDKSGFGENLEFSRTFAGERGRFDRVCITVNINRDQVCRRKVVGTKFVKGYTIPDRTEEVVEWECDEPLLKDSK